MDLIPFNQPYVTGNEWEYIQDAVAQGRLSSNGKYTHKCQQFFERRFGFRKTFLTHSCTQALEMVALLLNLGPDDEVILPSYAYVSTANAFAIRGCRLVFADSRPDYPGIDETKIEGLISSRTRAIVVVHYGGIACNMEALLDLCKKHELYLIEDAAAALEGYYLSRDGDASPLGSLGILRPFLFTKRRMSAVEKEAYWWSITPCFSRKQIGYGTGEPIGLILIGGKAPPMSGYV